MLAQWCGFPEATAGSAPTLEVATYTHYLNGPNVPTEPNALRLRVRPVASITSIHDDINRDWTYDATDLVAAGDYTLDAEEGKVYLHSDSVHGGWSSGTRILKVIYTAGFDTGSHVAVTQGITALVAHWWQQRNTAGLESVTLTDTTIEPLATEIPAHVREIMWPVRLVEVGMGGG